MFPPYVPWPVDLTDRVLNIYRFHWLHADMCDPVIMSCSPNTTVSERALAMSPVLLYGSAMGRKLRFSLVAAGIGAAPQAPVLGSQPDYPYDGNVSCAARTLLRYEIPAANGLTAIQEDDVEIGLQRWGLLRNFEGNPHVTINESTAAGHFDVIGATLDGNLAQADCVNNRLIFDPAAMGGNRTRWRIIGAHEAGHALGLSHTGDEDNTITAATEPYLATCLPPNAQTTDDVWTPRIDDDAQLTRVQSPFLNANLGFEYADGVNQAYFWTRTNATTISSTASNGTRSMRVDTNGSFTQSVHVEWPDAVARDVRLQARYRFDSGASGPLNFKLYSRGRNFPPERTVRKACSTKIISTSISRRPGREKFWRSTSTQLLTRLAGPCRHSPREAHGTIPLTTTDICIGFASWFRTAPVRGRTSMTST